MRTVGLYTSHDYSSFININRLEDFHIHFCNAVDRRHPQMDNHWCPAYCGQWRACLVTIGHLLISMGWKILNFIFAMWWTVHPEMDNHWCPAYCGQWKAWPGHYRTFININGLEDFKIHFCHVVDSPSWNGHSLMSSLLWTMKGLAGLYRTFININGLVDF